MYPVACWNAFLAVMNNRLKPFSDDEIAAIVFSLDIAETAEPLVPEAAKIQQELITELNKRAMQ